MVKFGRKIVKFRIPIFIISLLLLIPSVFGYIKTRVNYDVLYYLPKEIETMQGQDILVDEFGTGAYSMFICEGMENKDVAKLKTRIEEVDHVEKVVWYDSILDLSVPMDILPEKVALINARKSPIRDDYIEKYLAEKELDLTATLDAKAAYADADFVVIAAPTNYDSQTQHFDTSAV